MKKQIHFLRTAGVFLAVTVTLLFLANAYMGIAEAAFAPSLGTAINFGVLAGSTVTNTGATVVNGNLGVSPGTAVVGFPSGVVVPPSTIQTGNAVAGQAKTDLTTAYNSLAAQPCNVDLTGQNLGGMTLTPGVYCFPSTSAQLTGTVTLNAQNNPNAIFIFQIGSTLITASSSAVNITNAGSACKVFWQVGSSATLGTGTAFKGNILANTSITLNTGANINPGRALARTGAVTMDTNSVTMAGCGTPTPTPTLQPATQTPVAPTQTAIAPTQTPIAPTQTAIAPTQTPIAPTQTAVAPTQTPVAPVQTAIAPKPTAIAPTPTPNLFKKGSDLVPPIGSLTGTGTDGLGNKFIQITVKDLSSGMASIEIMKSINATTVIPAFVPGTTQPVIVLSTKLNGQKGSTVLLKMTDMAGNISFGDPVLTLLSLENVKEARQSFKGIPGKEHFISVANSPRGLKSLEIVVNGSKFTLNNLKDNEIRVLSVADAMTKKGNQITLIGTGKKGASAFIVIGDSALEQPGTLSEFTRAQAKSATANFTWGDAEDAQ